MSDFNINVKVKEHLFQTNNLNLLYFDEAVSVSLVQYVKNTKLFIQDNFQCIYESILETLLVWQNSYDVKFEVFNNTNGEFNSIKCNDTDDFHMLLGLPVITLLDVCKDNFLYYSLSFYKNCRISIEHGLTAIFHENRLLDLDFADSTAMLQKLKWDERNSNLWETDNWVKRKPFNGK